MINWMKYRWIYFAISMLFISAGVFSLIKWGMNLGVDFKGGAILEYQLKNSVSTEELTQKIQNAGIGVSSIQQSENTSYLIKTQALTTEQNQTVTDIIKNISGSDVDQLRFESVGPSVGTDLVKKTVYALIISASMILLWVAYQFKSIKFGTSAVLAMLHDSLILLGMFALLGHFFGAEVDFLFVTAVLTILSFSVHDTIVVYDRIRESQRKLGGNLYDLANRATTETMARSINNSMTIIFMLVAMVLLGGTSIKWFSVALLIGTISGTYSSPFVAVSLLVTWDQIEAKVKSRRK